MLRKQGIPQSKNADAAQETEPLGMELAIPGSKLELLSQFPRVWHGAP
jgi:hypothetical protein